jgi:hypothetical protein
LIDGRDLAELTSELDAAIADRAFANEREELLARLVLRLLMIVDDLLGQRRAS